MTIPLALFASSYNDSDVSGSTIQNTKSSYMDGGKNMYSLANTSSGNTKQKNTNLRKTIKQKPTTPNESTIKMTNIPKNVYKIKSSNIEFVL